MVDEHKLQNAELCAFVMIRSDELNGGDGGSRWWKGTDLGVAYVTNYPGSPIQVAIVPVPGTVPLEAPATTPDPAAGQGNTFAQFVDTPVDVVPPGTPGNLYLMEAVNPDIAANAYVAFFDEIAANVVLGTTPPLWTFGAPLGLGSSTTGGIRSEQLVEPLAFLNGLSVAVVTVPLGSTVVATPIYVAARTRT